MAGAFGAIIGSFAGCCIYRIPRGQYYTFSDEQLDAFGDNLPPPVPFNEPVRSMCPQCENQLLWWHNIPLVSWLLLGGKCYFCKAKVPARYFFVEALTAAAALGTYYQFGFSLTALVLFAFITALIILTFIDIDWFTLPDVITLPGSLIALVIVAINHWFHVFAPPIAPDLWASWYGWLCGAGILWLVSEVYFRIRKIDGLGLGDVKLLAIAGILMGYEASVYSIFVGSLLGSVLGSLILLVQRKGLRNNYIPFGPYLAVAMVLYVFTGTWLTQLAGEYLQTKIFESLAP